MAITVQLFYLFLASWTSQRDSMAINHNAESRLPKIQPRRGWKKGARIKYTVRFKSARALPSRKLAPSEIQQNKSILIKRQQSASIELHRFRTFQVGSPTSSAWFRGGAFLSSKILTLASELSCKNRKAKNKEAGPAPAITRGGFESDKAQEGRKLVVKKSNKRANDNIIDSDYCFHASQFSPFAGLAAVLLGASDQGILTRNMWFCHRKCDLFGNLENDQPAVSSFGNALLPPPAVVQTACGFVAGSAGAIAAYPIDFVKSQLQTEAGRAKYSGGLEAAVDIVKEGGPMALYRGVPVQVMGVAPEKTIKLSVNEAARNVIMAQVGSLPIAGEVVAGGFAGMMQVCVTNPLEVVKVRMQTSKMTLGEVISELKSFGDLYLGAGACIARDMTFSAVLFPTYAHVKVALVAALASLGGDSGIDAGVSMFWANMMAGSLAAAPAAVIATPADVVKTRMQQAREGLLVDGLLLSEQNGSSANTSQVIQDLIQEGGLPILYSGCIERVVRSAPQFGVTLAVFDVLNSMVVEHGWIIAA
eukprot:scaffold4095_cov117-Cylindrotheca_fusiformis.AAC.22